MPGHKGDALKRIIDRLWWHANRTNLLLRSWPLSKETVPSHAFLELQKGKFPLCSHWWRLSRGNGDVLCDRVRFLPDGRILGATNPNEHRWQIETSVALQILSEANTVTTIFDTITWAGQVPILSGRFIEDNSVIHILTPNLGDMHIEIFQTQFRGSMLIIPTSRGRPFDGTMTRWELWHLPREVNIDHMRIAEHIDSKCWYTNKTIRIMEQLRSFVAQGYRSFHFFGLSSGGYAALLLAELLAKEFAELEICSVAINPQTKLGDEVAHYFSEANISPELWPELIADDDLSHRDILIFNISDVISARGTGSTVEHHIYYDAGNPCEAYFAGLVEPAKSITLHPFSYALPHAAGIAKIYEDHKDEIARLIVGPSACAQNLWTR